MNKFITVLILVLLGGVFALCAAQQESLSPDLKAAALKDAACSAASDASLSDLTLEALPIRSEAETLGRLSRCRAHATAKTPIATRWFISAMEKVTSWRCTRNMPHFIP